VRVVVAAVGAEHVLEVAAAEDEDSVEAVGARRADSTLGEGVCVRRLARRADEFEVFRSEGINVIHTPIRASQANAYAERFVRTECLDWLLIIGRHHLETVLRIYTAHCNQERPQSRLERATEIRALLRFAALAPTARPMDPMR
jgi:hypothetical protein